MACPLLSMLMKNFYRVTPVRLFSVTCRSSINSKPSVFPVPEKKLDYPKRPTYQRVGHFYDLLEDPGKRVLRAFKYDYELAKGLVSGKKPPPITTHGSDVLIIGGGLVGTCIAYTLSREILEACNIVVVEKDLPECSSSLAIGGNGIYHQLPVKQYHEMTKYAADFYRQLTITFDSPDFYLSETDFIPNSSLQLVTESGIELLEDVASLYNESSWRHKLLNPESLKSMFPWINTEGIALGCLGLQGEGMYNQLKVLNIMRERAKTYGVTYSRGDLVGFEFRNVSQIFGEESGRYLSPFRAAIQSPDGDFQLHNFSMIIIAAGPETGNIVNKLNIKEVNHLAPIEARKRFMYTLHCPKGPGIDTPMVIDPNGLHFRKIGLSGDYVVWKDPAQEDEPSCDTLCVDENYFKHEVLPALVHRVPSLKDYELTTAQAGLIDVNVLDGELMVGRLPDAPNVTVVAGFEHDEFALAPAVARSIVENILYGEDRSIDLSVFELERFIDGIKLSRHRFS